jgi:ricin-type beta-trefoil lectin protein
VGATLRASVLSIAGQAVYGFSFQLENRGDGTCLDADSAQPRDRGTIFQWACNASDKYQRWKVVGTVGHLPILQNAGTGTCLDADSRQIYDRGKIFQWHCRTTDPYQQCWFLGSGQLHINGNADAVMHSQGTQTTCLDSDGSSRGDRAPIFQWSCNQSDIYQLWN